MRELEDKVRGTIQNETDKRDGKNQMNQSNSNLCNNLQSPHWQRAQEKANETKAQQQHLLQTSGQENILTAAEDDACPSRSKDERTASPLETTQAMRSGAAVQPRRKLASPDFYTQLNKGKEQLSQTQQKPQEIIIANPAPPYMFKEGGE